jgi:enterochelin esterase-like enzyme
MTPRPFGALALDSSNQIESMRNYIGRFYLALPLAIALPFGTARGQPQGSVAEFAVPSTQYGRSRRVWVYTPANYPESCGQACPVLVAFDGGVYLRDIPLPGILDSLIAARTLPPTVALLIDNASSAERLADLANHTRFAAFMGDELIPWLRGKWRVTHDPARTIITGSSAGGLASAYLALKRPDLFGNVLSQSGAYWRGNEGSNDAPYEWLTGQYSTSAKQAIRFVVDVGSKESVGAMGGAAPSILEANRRLRDVLRAKGYAVEYFEVPDGVHAPETWRVRLPLGLAALAAP